MYIIHVVGKSKNTSSHLPRPLCSPKLQCLTVPRFQRAIIWHPTTNGVCIGVTHHVDERGGHGACGICRNRSSRWWASHEFGPPVITPNICSICLNCNSRLLFSLSSLLPPTTTLHIYIFRFVSLHTVMPVNMHYVTWDAVGERGRKREHRHNVTYICDRQTSMNAFDFWDDRWGFCHYNTSMLSMWPSYFTI